MATKSIELPLVVIVGPTASGKTALSVRLAQQFGGEVISADSRAVYRDLSVGTAKPTVDERQGVPHWGIDLVDPGERFTVADFQSYAIRKIAEIRSRGKIPFLVGGTGLYVDAVVYDFEFPSLGNDTRRRDDLMEWSMEKLYEYCLKHNVELPENRLNKRHVVGVILRNGQQPQRKHELNENTVIVGIATEKNILNERIEERSKAIFSQGIMDEAAKAGKKYGWESEAMTGNVYPLIREYLAEKASYAETVERFVVLDRKLAKRQLTWFRRNKDIVWLPLDEAYNYVAHKLSELSKA